MEYNTSSKYLNSFINYKNTNKPIKQIAKKGNIMTSLSQEQVDLSIETKIPSFSIVFETENLSSVELENIYQSLASIAAQDISPEQANEFLIIDGGYAPKEVIEQMCSKYPWITVRQMPGIGYHEAKMMGATLITGEIVVFCDSDCVYVPTWLRDVLTLFVENENSDVNIVAGESSTPVRNPHELAIAMHYFFPRFSNQEQAYVSSYYFLNSVAFRRDFLLQNPIPNNLPLYRSYCYLHIYSLCDLKGYKIWKHPKARATHEPPTPSFCFWRYLLMGRDQVLRERIKLLLIKNPDMTDYPKSCADLNFTLSVKISGIITTIFQIKPFDIDKIRPVLREDKGRLFLFPLAVPIMLWFELLFTIGKIITYLEPDLIIKLYYKSEEKLNPSA